MPKIQLPRAARRLAIIEKLFTSKSFTEALRLRSDGSFPIQDIARRSKHSIKALRSLFGLRKEYCQGYVAHLDKDAFIFKLDPIYLNKATESGTKSADEGSNPMKDNVHFKGSFILSGKKCIACSVSGLDQYRYTFRDEKGTHLDIDCFETCTSSEVQAAPSEAKLAKHRLTVDLTNNDKQSWDSELPITANFDPITNFLQFKLVNADGVRSHLCLALCTVKGYSIEEPAQA